MFKLPNDCICLFYFQVGWVEGGVVWGWLYLINSLKNQNKGNTKRGVSPRLKIRPCDLDLRPWKSIRFQILLRSKNVPSLVKIHWRMLILVFTRMLCSKNLTLWHWKSIGFQTLLRTKYVPSLVKIHWRILILECSQGCYAVKFDLVTLIFDLENQ
jgi:hypothetical protein